MRQSGSTKILIILIASFPDLGKLVSESHTRKMQPIWWTSLVSTLALRSNIMGEKSRRINVLLEAPIACKFTIIEETLIIGIVCERQRIESYACVLVIWFLMSNKRAYNWPLLDSTNRLYLRRIIKILYIISPIIRREHSVHCSFSIFWIIYRQYCTLCGVLQAPHILHGLPRFPTQWSSTAIVLCTAHMAIDRIDHWLGSATI